MIGQKNQIQQAAQSALAVLNGAKDGSDHDWLVLDYEQSKIADTQIDQVIEGLILKSLPKQLKGINDKAYSALAYTGATISLLPNETAEAHRGRTGSAIEQLNQLLALINEQFPEVQS